MSVCVCVCVCVFVCVCVYPRVRHRKYDRSFLYLCSHIVRLQCSVCKVHRCIFLIFSERRVYDRKKRFFVTFQCWRKERLLKALPKVKRQCGVCVYVCVCVCCVWCLCVCVCARILYPLRTQCQFTTALSELLVYEALSYKCMRP